MGSLPDIWPQPRPAPAPRPGIQRVTNNRADYLVEHPAGLSPTAVAFTLLSLADPLPHMELSWALGCSSHTISTARAMLRYAPPPIHEEGWFRILPEFLDGRYPPSGRIAWVLLRRHLVNGRTGRWRRHLTFGARSMWRVGHNEGWMIMGIRSWCYAFATLRKDLWITPDGMENVGLAIPSVHTQNSLSAQNNSLSAQLIPSVHTKPSNKNNSLNNQPQVCTERITTSQTSTKGARCQGRAPWGGCALAPGQLPQCDDCPRSPRGGTK